MPNFSLCFLDENEHACTQMQRGWIKGFSELINAWDKCVLLIYNLEALLIKDKENGCVTRPFLFDVLSNSEQALSNPYSLGEFSLAYANIAKTWGYGNCILHYVNYVHENVPRMEAVAFRYIGVLKENQSIFKKSRFQEIDETLNDLENAIYALRRANAKYRMDHILFTETYIKNDGRTCQISPRGIDKDKVRKLMNRHYRFSLREILALCAMFDRESSLKQVRAKVKDAEKERYDPDFISFEELCAAYEGLKKILQLHYVSIRAPHMGYEISEDFTME